jgi:hypothetical protein
VQLLLNNEVQEVREVEEVKEKKAGEIAGPLLAWFKKRCLAW